MVFNMNGIFEYRLPRIYTFILKNILLICFIASLFGVALAYFDPKLSAIRAIVPFTIIYTFILIIWVYLRKSFHAIQIDFKKNEVGLNLIKRKEYVSFNFSEIDKIYLSNWLVLIINGKKQFLPGKVSVELIEALNRIQIVEWKKIAQLTYDRKIKEGCNHITTPLTRTRRGGRPWL